MLYCSEQDLIDRFGEDELIDLTDRINLGVINQQVLIQAITDASDQMSVYLSRFEFTAENLPKVLKPIACDITRYRLYDESITENVQKRYDAGMKFLMSVNKGEITIGTTTDGSKITSVDLAEIKSSGSVFSRENSTGFV